MRASFRSVSKGELGESIGRHLASLPSPIDSFLESHILEAAHYKITIAEVEVGFATIHKGNLITQFSLHHEYKRYGQSVFGQLKELEEVQSAFVPTCDEFFLAHALDDYHSVAKQAYFFALPSSYGLVSTTPHTLRQASSSDAGLIREGADDFFGDEASIEQQLKGDTLYLIYEGEVCVAFGVIERSRLIESVASIGMFVIPAYRKRGIGTDTLHLLIAECRTQGLRPVAGCWYYNHSSKKTLERAGMYTQTRLLKVDF